MMDRLFAITSWASGTTDRGRHIRHRVNYPETAAICGREDCEGPARLWLTELECADHQRGVRVFGIRTNAAKIHVSDELIQTETLPMCT
jgi:hypothetical protein